MSRVSLPADDGFLEQHPTQWWYWTGHLATDTGRRFGFEMCFFAFHDDVLLGQQIGNHLGREGVIDRLTSYGRFQMVDTALTDVAGGRYLYDCLFAIGRPLALPGSFQLASHWPHTRAVVASGGNGRDSLEVSLAEWGLNLSIVSDAGRPPMLQYGGSCHEYCFGGYTFYYSRPCMSAAGTVRVGGEAFPVTGTVWFDRQYGELNQLVHCGWQWFALQFDDDRQVMVFDVTGEPSERYGSISRGGDQQIFAPSSLDVQVLDHWASPTTGIVYPSKWQVTFAGETVIVTPLVADQEMREPWPWPAYWEGDSVIATPDGRPIGRAYVELNGFKRP